MSLQKRRHQRVPSAIPFTLDDGSEAITRDLSPSGVYFETEGPVVITRNGKAVAVLVSTVDDDDIESLVLARSRDLPFWRRNSPQT